MKKIFEVSLLTLLLSSDVSAMVQNPNPLLLGSDVSAMVQNPNLVNRGFVEETMKEFLASKIPDHLDAEEKKEYEKIMQEFSLPAQIPDVNVSLANYKTPEDKGEQENKAFTEDFLNHITAMGEKALQTWENVPENLLYKYCWFKARQNQTFEQLCSDINITPAYIKRHKHAIMVRLWLICDEDIFNRVLGSTSNLIPEIKLDKALVHDWFYKYPEGSFAEGNLGSQNLMYTHPLATLSILNAIGIVGSTATTKQLWNVINPAKLVEHATKVQLCINSGLSPSLVDDIESQKGSIKVSANNSADDTANMTEKKTNK